MLFIFSSTVMFERWYFIFETHYNCLWKLATYI